ncbi:unnamed protein product [Polarella glacialis]|uniref:NYN domain-containing protein n=1 Tax=Polarella glacialis TaxID=89957 RepID=A0A813D9S2_POLGL|nr:unnamed protein product [Polarella glacialis]CAE8708848.1 unnamed protein product [Polarella glacialis]
MDGDCFGMDHFAAAIDALEARGKVVSCSAFVPPHRTENATWRRAAEQQGFKFVSVPRRVGSKKDPNHIAISAEAVKLAGENAVSCIALLVNELDFVYLADFLNSMGQRTMLLVPDDRKQTLMSEFKTANADVVNLALDYRHPTQNAMLLPGGKVLWSPYQATMT